jgi:hypothetical protein
MAVIESLPLRQRLSCEFTFAPGANSTGYRRMPQVARHTEKGARAGCCCFEISSNLFTLAKIRSFANCTLAIANHLGARAHLS